MSMVRGDGRQRPGSSRAAKRARQQHLRELIARHPIASQHELVERLAERGFAVTQATVSRDIGEMGLVKLTGVDGPAYTAPGVLGAQAVRSGDERLRRVLADYDVRLARSGLILLLLSEAGSASAIAQAIDASTLEDQAGTLAGDDTVLVLFPDEARLLRWQERFEALRSEARRAGPGTGS